MLMGLQSNILFWKKIDRTALISLRAIYKCSYRNSIGDVSDCAELMSLADIHEDAEPRGLATDTSDHLWVAVANVGDNGAVLEINPETQEVVSTFGEFRSLVYTVLLWC